MIKYESKHQMKRKSPYHLKNGFKTPDNYFEDLEARVMGAVVEENVLPDLKYNHAGFNVPDAYFDNVEIDILARVNSEKEGGKLITLFNTSKYYYAAAVAAVFIGIVSTLLFNPVMDELSIDAVELSALEDYIDEGNINLNFNEISAFMAEEGYSFDEFNTSGLSDEEVFNYLNENIEDPNLLLE